MKSPKLVCENSLRSDLESMVKYSESVSGGEELEFERGDDDDDAFFF